MDGFGAFIYSEKHEVIFPELHTTETEESTTHENHE
jgi:hypothetical protein